MDLNIETINKAVDILLSMGVSVQNINLSGKGKGSIFDKLTFALIGKKSAGYQRKLYRYWHRNNIFKSSFIDKSGIADSVIKNDISLKMRREEVNSSSFDSLRVSKVFHYPVGSIEIDRGLWMEELNYDEDGWRFIHVKLKEMFTKEFNVCRDIKFLGKRERKGRFEDNSNVTDYCLCKVQGCSMRYRIDYFIPSSSGNVKVCIRSSNDINTITHELNDKPPINKLKLLKNYKLLKTEKISCSTMEVNKGQDDSSRYLKGSWQSDTEENFPQLDNDIFVDKAMLLEFEKYKKNSIIQCISSPLQINIFSYERLEIIKYKDKLTMHLSCSAGIGKIQADENGKLLYYSGVIDNVKGSCLPVLEFFLLDKDNLTLNSCLTNFLRFCSTIVLAWPFNRIVVDYSRVMIRSVLSVWNSTNLVSYVNDAYHLITVNNYDVENNFAIYTTVHICTSSFMKLLLEILKSNCAENAAHKRFYLHVMATIIDSKCLDDILNIFVSLVIISKSSFKHDMFEKHLVSLKCFMINADTVLFDSIINTCQDRESFWEEFDQNDTTLDDWWQVSTDENLFYNLFRESFDNALYQINETEQLEQNRLINNDDYKFDAFCDILVNRFMGILPLWSCILYKDLHYLDSHLTNDPVHRYHQSIKQYIPHNPSDLPLGYLIRKISHKNDDLVKILKSGPV